MHILMIFQYAPLPPPYDLAGTKRNLPFLQENLKRHEVSVLSYGSSGERQIFCETIGKACKQVHFVNGKRPLALSRLEKIWLLATGRSTFRQLYSKKMQRQLDELVKREKFDLIHCCTQLFGYLQFPEDITLVGDTHEVTYDLIYRTYKTTKNVFLKLINFLNYKFGKREEIKLCMRFDAIIATTKRDCEVFCRHLPAENVHVVQNGVDPRFFELQEVKVEPRTMVFTGMMSYYPNNHGILFFLDEVFPLILSQVPDARLYVVGANPSRRLQRRSSGQVVISGFVEDVRPYIARGEVFIIPLLIGGGIRGKALEAMAMKKPIVTTSIGCEGINLKHESSALFADTPGEFADSVVRLFNDQALRTRLAEKAYANAVDGYNWNTRGEELQRVYETVLLNEPTSHVA